MLTVGVVSLGCSKNRVDTELMLHILQANGYALTLNEREADILIVNTCGFIEPAKQESIDTLLELSQYKKTGRLKLLVATGCLTQRYEKALWEGMPEVDLLLGVEAYERLPALLKRALAGERVSDCGVHGGVLAGERVLTTAPYTAYVRIADGCDNRCAYCAIPLIRGGYRSRELDDVLREIASLAAGGVREHVLVAQDTSRFGVDKVGRSLLPELMTRAADIPGVDWLRVLYCYPDTVDERLLEAMASRDNICRYLDLPLQHADPELLRRMNRRGDIDATRALLLRARAMGFTLRTTMITGFPGETEAQFQTLLDFVADIRFDRLGAFAFSAEDDTPAADMPDQVPPALRQERLDRLMALQQGIALERNRVRVGAVEKVLLQSVSDDGRAEGRTAAEAPETDGLVRLTGARGAEPGTFVRARIMGARPYDLTGVLL